MLAILGSKHEEDFPWGRTEIVKYLVGHGAQINVQDKDVRTPLHLAVIYGSIEIVKYLMKSGAKIDEKDVDGCTPLHLAASESPTNNALEIVKYLIECGAQYDVKNLDGKIPLEVAQTEDVKEFFTELKMNIQLLKSEETVSNKDPCIICHGPRNGFYVLLPCGHASLCENCCKTVTNQKFAKCPTCRRPAKSYTKIFFQAPE